MSSVSRTRSCLAGALAVLSLTSCGSESPVLAPETTQNNPPHRAAVRVLVAKAENGVLESRPLATGLTRAFHRAQVAAEVSGRILRRAAEPGASVLVGAPLVVLDPTRAQLALDEARARLMSRQTDLDEATRDAQRGEKLASEKAISDSELDRLDSRRDRTAAALSLSKVQLARAIRNLEDTTVRAPFDGIVESIDVDAGEFIRAGTPVGMVIDLARIRVHAGVTANEARRLAPGDPLQIVFDAGNGRPHEGTIQSIGQVAHERNGTFAVEIWLPNPNREIRDGMTATIAFKPSAQSDGPLIPRAALARSSNGAVVFVVEGTGAIQTAAQRRVRLGRSDDESIEVLEGVQAGEMVVIDGHFALNDQSPVLVDRNDGA